MALPKPAARHTAVLFDWDGTLANSQALNYQCLRDALAAHSCPLEQAWFDARTGTSTEDMVSLGAELHGRSLDAGAVARLRNSLYLRRLSEVTLMPEVVSVLHSCAPHRRTALATGGARDTVMPTVAALGLASAFDAVVTREDVPRGKPSPDIFLLAARRLAVHAEACVVYEDSNEGLAAAAAAGMDAIDVRPHLAAGRDR